MINEKNVRKYLELNTMFNNRCEEILELLFELRCSHWIHGIETFEIENIRGEDFVCIQSEEYHTGWGEHERDYSEFPLRYLWVDNQIIKAEYLEDKKKREKAKLERDKIKAEEMGVRIEKEERALLKRLDSKYNN